jgi:hypothetical protein
MENEPIRTLNEKALWFRQYVHGIGLNSELITSWLINNIVRQKSGNVLYIFTTCWGLFMFLSCVSAMKGNKEKEKHLNHKTAVVIYT